VNARLDQYQITTASAKLFHTLGSKLGSCIWFKSFELFVSVIMLNPVLTCQIEPQIANIFVLYLKRDTRLV